MPSRVLCVALLVAGTSSCLTRPTQPVNEFERDHYVDPYPSNMAGLDYRFGVEELSNEAWAPLDTPIAMSFTYRSYLNIKPLELEFGGGYAYDRAGGGSSPLSRLRVYEIDLGLAASTPLGPENALLEPYFGAGLALLLGRADFEQGGGIDTFEDGDLGYYFHGGVRVYITESQYVAADWRWLRESQLDLGLGPLDSDYHRFSIGLGFSF